MLLSISCGGELLHYAGSRLRIFVLWSMSITVLHIIFFCFLAGSWHRLRGHDPTVVYLSHLFSCLICCIHCLCYWHLSGNGVRLRGLVFTILEFDVSGLWREIFSCDRWYFVTLSDANKYSFSILRDLWSLVLNHIDTSCIDPFVLEQCALL